MMYVPFLALVMIIVYARWPTSQATYDTMRAELRQAAVEREIQLTEIAREMDMAEKVRFATDKWKLSGR